MSGFFFPPPPPPPPSAAHPSGGQPGQRGSSQPYNRGRGEFGSNRGYGHRGRGQFAGHTERSSNGNHSYQNANQRGRSHPAAYRHNSFSSGRGQPHTLQNQSLPPGAFVNPNFATRADSGHYHGESNGQSYLQTDVGSSQNHTATPGSAPRTAAGHKRKLEALRGPQQERIKKPGPETTPAIPSFGAPVFTANQPSAAQAPDSRPTNEKKQKPPTRGLGLVPPADSEAPAYSDSEDDKDIDEESMYAELGNKLTFEHNGVVLSLNSQADLTAWKKDRQKNWPTKSRMAEKEVERRQVGEERRRLLAGAELLQKNSKAQKSKTQRQRGNMASNDRTSTSNVQSTGSVSTGATAAQQSRASALEKVKTELEEQSRRLEELRRKVAASETRNREAKARKELQSQTFTDADAQASETDVQGDSVLPKTEGVVDEESKYANAKYDEQDISEPSSSEPSADSTSELSSDSDPEDSAPEEMASKPPAEQPPATQKPLCRYFAASGHCRDGDACRFRHERVGLPTSNGSEEANRKRAEQGDRLDGKQPDGGLHSERRSIFQRLVEQEQVEEDKLALRVIKYLGKAGFFSASMSREE